MPDQADRSGMMGRMAPLCVDKLEFLAIEDIEPDFSFESQGFIGLAPGSKLPWRLKNDDNEASVSFHKDGNNTVVAFNEQKPFADLRNFYNLADSSWALPLSKMSLDQNEISARDLPVDPQRLAFIDSRINTI